MPSLRSRLAVALGIAVLTVIWYAWGVTHIGDGRSDWDQLWFAARALAHHTDPYPLVGPGKAFDWPWPFFYPPMAVAPALPFGWMALPVARLAYAFTLAFSFAFLLTRDGWYRLTACMSGAYLSAMSLLQWSPLAACAILAPNVFGWMAVGKPNLGLMNIAASRTRRDLTAYVWWCAGLLICATITLPLWPIEWRAAIASATQVKPYLLRPGGFLLLLAWLRWRRPEARWLGMLALVPSTVGSADALVLWAFPHSFREGLMLAILTHLANFYLLTRPKPPTFDGVIAMSTATALVLIWIPALVVVLTRPNTTG